jgi:hypothetical protein
MDPTKTQAEEAEPGKAEALERAKAEAVVKARLEVEQRTKARAGSQVRPVVEQPQQEHPSAEEKYRQRIEEKERRRIAEEERRRAEAEELRLAAEEDRQRAEEKERQRLAEEERLRAEEEERQRAIEEQERQRAEEEERQRIEAEEKQRAEEEERQRAAEEEERKRVEAEEQQRAAEEERKRVEEEELKRALEEKERQRVEAEERQRAAEEEERKRAEEEERKRVEEEDRRRVEEEERRHTEEEERRHTEEEERRHTEEEERRHTEEEERRHTEEERQHYLKQQALLKAEAEGREKPAPTQPEPVQPAEPPAHETGTTEQRHPKVVEAAGKEVLPAETGERTADGTPAEPVPPGPGRIERLRAASLLVAKRMVGKLLALRAPVRSLLADGLRHWGTWVTLLGFGVLAALAVAVMQIQGAALDVAPFEKAAADRLGEPVRIGAIHIALLPRPHLRLENIAIGKEQQIRIASMKAVQGIGAMLNRRMEFKHIGIDGLQLPQVFVARALWGKGDDHALRVDRVTVTHLTLELQGKAVPGFDLEAVFGPAGLQSAELSRPENDLSVTLQVEGGKTQIEASARRFVMPFADRLELEALSAKGTVSALGLDFSEFSARSFDGAVSGSVRLNWRDGWRLEGKIKATGIDATKLGVPVFSGGRLDGEGNYAMRAAAPEKLLDALRLDGSFSVQNGTIANIDLTRLVQRESAEGGSTPFSELSGSVLAEEGRIQLRQLRLAAGTLSSGGGEADVDAQGNLSGRMLLQVHTQSTLGLALLGIAGTLKQPQFIRSL